MQHSYVVTLFNNEYNHITAYTYKMLKALKSNWFSS